MKCPYCDSLDNKVIDSRLSESDEAIRRRRECNDCGRRFTTYERIEQSPLLVIKRDGNRQEYDRNNIIRGVISASEKRPVSNDDILALVARVESLLADEFENEIPTSAIGEAVMEELRKLDSVAYVRFASVYRAFEDVGEFIDEATRIIDKK